MSGHREVSWGLGTLETHTVRVELDRGITADLQTKVEVIGPNSIKIRVDGTLYGPYTWGEFLLVGHFRR